MRAWLQQTLLGIAGVTAHVGTRVFQGGSLSSSTTRKPYLVVKLGNDTRVRISEDSDPHRQFITIYVHDSPGDYSRIDSIIEELISGLVNKGSPADGVLAVEYLETSQDLDDETLNTILRYVRFQAVRSRT